MQVCRATPSREEGTFVISRKTTLALSDVYEALFNSEENGLDNSGLRDFLYGNEWQPWVLDEVGEMARRVDLRQWLLGLHTGESLERFPERLLPDGRLEVGRMLLRQLARDVLISSSEGRLPTSGDAVGGEIASSIARLQAMLELDGFSWDGFTLTYSEADDFNAEPEAGEFESLLREVQLPRSEVLERHLARSEGYYVEGEWAESAAHSRRLLEFCLREAASKQHLAKEGTPLDPRVYGRPEAIRDRLTAVGILSEREAAAMAATLEMLRWEGAPGLTNPREHAQLARRIALPLAGLVLRRLRNVLRSPGRSDEFG